ncbi:LiaI-LiaF-like domain-containing protein [Peribacillus sp. SCS-37]|uniref:LiaI-LiaF-like domain-containing protein n=1 Tax=Paraperibacillus esterisolvens TaxID=3115296 RepID=UPI003905E96B
MNSQRFFPGIILIAFGVYFLLEQAGIEPFEGFFTWPTLLLITGLSFLIGAYGGREHEAILPGVVLSGLGIHFHIVNKFQVWPDHIGVFLLIIGLGFILRAKETKSGMFHGVLLLAISVFMLFYDKIMNWMGLLETGISSAWNFWPVFLIGTGLFFVMGRKKK